MSARRARITPETGRRLAYGLVAATVAAQPLLHPGGPMNSSPVDAFTGPAVIAVLIWVAPLRGRLRGPLLLPATLLVAAGAIAGLAGPMPGTALVAVVQDLFLIAWFLAVVCVACAPDGLRLLLRTWSRAAISWAVILLIADVLHIAAITGVTPREGNRVPFTFGDPNFAALYWGASIFVVHASQTPRRRSTRIAAYVVLTIAMGLGESNGSLLQMGAGIALLVLLATTRRYGGPAALALAITLGGTAAVVYHEVPPKKIAAWALHTNVPILVNSLGRIGGSTGQRGALIQETTQLYLEHGVAGVGPNVTKPQLTQENYPYPNEVHNDVLAMVVERGPLGLAAWLLLLASVGMCAITLVRRPLRPAAAAALPHPAGLVAATLAFTVAGFYEEVQHQRYMWAMWALVAVAAAQTVSGVTASRPVRRYPGLQRPVLTSGPFARRGWVV